MTGAFDLRQFLRDCRLAVCEAFYHEGSGAALAELTVVSLQVAPFVAEDDLDSAYAWDTLAEVAHNLKLTQIFGIDAVQASLASGPNIYAAISRQAAAA
jgi:hypothetical protein